MRTSRKSRGAAIVLGVVFLCAGAPARSPVPIGKAPPAKTSAYRSVRIDGVPHVRQKPDFCGEACAAMWLAKLGHAKMDQDHVFDRSGLSPPLGRGCYTRDLDTALTRIGFRTGGVAAYVEAAKAKSGMEVQWSKLHADLLKGVPSILCMHYDDPPRASEHFRLILGYDAKTDEVLYHDPAEAGGAYLRMKRGKLLRLWPLKYGRVLWTIIRLRLEPGTIHRPSESALAAKFTSADYAQHIMKLKRKIPRGAKFHIVVQPPFVVIGDEKPDVVQHRAEWTVKWAVDCFKKLYFSKDPDEILDIWLFQDKASYRKYTKEIFGHNPGTPFGYYSHSAKALVMNIRTGGGTLVHEIVHPFVAANFPNCPAWFNEGLGSLYEQCGRKGDTIWAYTNWRLPGLQKHIRAKRLPSFKQLTATTDNQFYGGDNYGQARYLCYYLQEKGLLPKYYHAFHAARKTDPTGYETLKKVLGEPDMNAFQKRWEAWVLKLRY